MALQVELTEGEQFRVWRRSTTNVEAWRLTGQAADQVRRFTREGNARARSLAEQAIGLDPENATASVVLGWTYMAEALVGWTPSAARSIDGAAEFAQKAAAILQIDPAYSTQRWARGSPYRNPGDLERGLDALRRAGLPGGDAAPLAPLAAPLR